MDRVQDKILSYDQLRGMAEACRAAGRRIGHCHGCFDIVHPGHVRHLQHAAEQADVLVVSLTADDAIEKDDGARPYIPQELRAESLAALGCVDYVVIAAEPTAEGVLQVLQPHLYFKGQEYEGSNHPGFLREKQLVESNGGQVIFSSGEVVYSSTRLVELVNRSEHAQGFELDRLKVILKRWQVDAGRLVELIRDQFGRLRVAVVGDVVWDHYIFCEASDVAKEAPMLSVKPLYEQRYPGAAAIIALTLRAMGATVDLMTGFAEDADGRAMVELMADQRVTLHAWPNHQRFPVKTRYLAETHKLFKVDRADCQPLASGAQNQLLGKLADLAESLDVVIFADFDYGTLSPTLIGRAGAMLRDRVPLLVGDVSGPRRSLMAFDRFDLLCPTEKEIRGVHGDFANSLPTLAAAHIQQLNVRNLMVTMSQRGCVMFRPRQVSADGSVDVSHRLRSDYLPSLARQVVDPIGAGDAMLAVASLAMGCGCALPEAGYLGSLAAGLAVERIGNQVITADDLVHAVGHRPELRD